MPYPLKQMEEEHSKLWRLALVLSLIAFAAASYFRIPSFRAYVDENYPWVKAQLAQHGLQIADTSSEAKTESAPSEPAHQAAQTAATPSINLDQLALNRSLWPKDVTLKKQIVFPAVVDGREAGKIAVPAGTMVQLYRIENHKLGVVFNGGGAWVQVAETDLPERVRAIQGPR